MLHKLLAEQRPLIMGILNVTPDSFSDGGQYFRPEDAIERGLEMVEQGADIVDIGGESTRPGADVISPEVEMERVTPVIKALREYKVPLSIDTRNAMTMQAAVEAGASIINDVSGLTHDPKSLEIAAKTDAHIVIMHAQGTPQDMQDNPQYSNVFNEVYGFLDYQIKACALRGISRDRLIIDPGIGFGKTLEHNLELLKNLRRFEDLGCPILLGTSRKSFINYICDDDIPADERLGGSIASALWGVQNGAKILRVHDVAQTKQAVGVYNAISAV